VADGLRRRMVTGANTTDYLLDGQSVVREIKNGVIDATYLVGPRGPEYKRDQNGAVQWYLYDGLGSVVGLVDSSGNVTNARKYDVYGAPRNAQTSSAHCFVGGLRHTSDAETGLMHMRARYMDPATGRFVSEDPARHGANWFAYCVSDPANRLDPDGRRSRFSFSIKVHTLLMGIWSAVADNPDATWADVAAVINGDLYIAPGRYGGLTPEVVEGVVEFDMDERGLSGAGYDPAGHLVDPDDLIPHVGGGTVHNVETGESADFGGGCY
jgi:RHS repeat-associated protein